jgi:WD40 repeat protein
MNFQRMCLVILLSCGFSFAQLGTDWSRIDRQITLLKALHILTLEFSPDGQRLATGNIGGLVQIWDVATGAELKQFQASSKRVEDIAFSPKGQSLATVSDDGTARVWNLATGKEQQRFVIEPEPSVDLGIVKSVAFHPDGQRLVTGSWSGMIHVLEISSGKLLRKFQGDGSVDSLEFSPDGRSLLTSGRYAHLWDIDSGKDLRRFEGHLAGYGATDVAFSRDGTMVATSSNDGTARVWEAATGKELKRFEGHHHIVRDVAFSPSGKILATTGGDQTVRLWEISSGKELKSWGSSGPNQYTDVAFSADGTRLAVAGYPFFTGLYGTPDFDPVF